jgi:diamine N-acetyltransferase
MSITLREVTKQNWVQCIRLKLASEQEGLVAPNIASIAESKFEPHYVPRAIYSNEKVVGFLMYCPEIETEEKDLYWLFRFMVDVEYQKQGIGKAALKLALNEIAKNNCRKINIIYSPKNSAAAKLYASFGFKQVGTAEDGDIIVQKRINEATA